MPKIKIDHVVSFSSEDPTHVANNILSTDPAKKWKCKETGERSATIVLQLEKACVISGIDVGNENSAYIEILVTRSGTTDNYKVLLVMSSFMTPLEARQSTNMNKVRMFTQNELSKPECDQKWDKIKIVCTQPFNRHVQYGLSFISFHTPGDRVSGPLAQTTIGKFSLRPESPDNLSIGSLFAKRNDQKEILSAAAAIREASTSGINKAKLRINNSSNNNGSDTESKPLPRNRNELLYSKDEEEPNEKIDKLIEKKQHEKEKTVTENSSPRAKINGESSKRKKNFEQNSTPMKKTKIAEKVRQRRPFNELLNGVVLVISGIQNPDRADLRNMALEMGAKYKPDWDNSCTHLICAFTNTPKFNQVKGKGKIVKKNWIEECHSQRKRLPWRKYCLDKSDSKKPESEDEIWEEDEREEPKKDDTDSTDEEGYDDTKMQKRIDEIQAKQQQKRVNNFNDVFSQDTDEEILDAQTDKTFPKTLLDFLDLKTFFIDETLDEDILQMLERYIIAYKGIVSENPSEDVDIFISSEDHAENFRCFKNAICVRPDWLWECHNSQKLVPTTDYVL